MPRIASPLFAGVACLAVAMICVAIGRSNLRDHSYTTRDVVAQVAHLVDLAEALAADGSLARSTTKTTHSVIIRKPSGPPRVELAGLDPHGRTGSVACSTCHAIRKPNLENVSADTLDEFHQGMTFNHGKITCYACHNPDDSNALRLADGKSVAYENVMTLCSQCHSMQAESFAHGAHGGMNGHWDLTRGPQIKNNCIDCHDPHAPTYPKMIVGFKPKDRFNPPLANHHDHQGAESHDDH